MAAKKKSSPAKPAKKAPTKKKSGAEDDPVYRAMARETAAQMTQKYLRSPQNRAQVIVPPGKNWKPGDWEFALKTKGRYAAAGRIYDKTYKEVLSYVDKQNASRKKGKGQGREI